MHTDKKISFLETLLPVSCVNQIATELKSLFSCESVENFLGNSYLSSSHLRNREDDKDFRKIDALAENALKVLEEYLPCDVTSSLLQILDRTDHVVIHLRGWPKSVAGDTPHRLGAKSASGFSGFIVAGLTRLLGATPTQMFDVISPSVEKGWNPAYGLHRDGCTFRNKSISCIFCIRSTGKGKTVFATLDELLQQFPDEYLRILANPIVHRDGEILFPALIRKNARWEFHFSQLEDQLFVDTCNAHTSLQENAIVAFRNLAITNMIRHQGIVLQPDELLIFKNHDPSLGVLLHGRTGFRDSINPSLRRWVKLMNSEVLEQH